MKNGAHALAIDLTEVRFIDSYGLAALLSDDRNANLRQGSLALSGLQPSVQPMFEPSRLLCLKTIPASRRH